MATRADAGAGPRWAVGRGWAAGIEVFLLAERAQVPLWSPAAFGLGITLYFMLPWSEQRQAAVVAALAVVALGSLASGATARLLVWAGVLVALGVGVAAWRSADVASPVLRDRFEGEVSGRVEAVEIRSGRGQVRFRLAPDDPGLPPHVRLSLKSSAVPAGLAPGARVSLKAMLLPPSGPSFPGGYDFARRAWFDQLGATGYPLGSAVVTRAAPPPAGFAAGLSDLRARLTRQLETGVGGDAGGMAAAFVTGDKGGLTSEVDTAMRNAGMAHLLAISGLHIAVVVGGTMWLARAALALSPWIALRWPVKATAAAAAAAAGIGYTLVAGGGAPTVRSCVATIIVLLGIIIGREALSLRMVAAGALLIMAVRPEALLGPSFQLSFAAVTGLVALYQSPVGRWLARGDRFARRRVRIAHHFAGLVVTGAIAEAMLAATALFHFNQTGIYGVLANLVAIPWTSFVVMPLLVLTLATNALGIGAPADWLLRHAMDALLALARTVAAWPGAVVHLGLMPVAAYALLVGGGLWLCLWATRVRWLGAVPVVVGAVLALTARPPDMLVSGDGHHVAVQIGATRTEGPRLALLRDRTGDYLRDVWGGVAAADADAAIFDLPNADCSLDACVARLGSADKTIRLLATLSKDRIGKPAFAPACAAADIVVSDRRLPGWCKPRWLKLDRTALGTTGAVAIWLSPRRVATVGELTGDHPWMPQPQVWRPRPGGRSRAARRAPVVITPSEPAY